MPDQDNSWRPHHRWDLALTLQAWTQDFWCHSVVSCSVWRWRCVGCRVVQGHPTDAYSEWDLGNMEARQTP